MKIRSVWLAATLLLGLGGAARAFPVGDPVGPYADPGITDYPCVAPNWDNTPRAGRRGLVLHGSHPDLFRRNLRQGVERALRLPPQERLLFIKSWNEWAEGNYLEPDLRFGHSWLEAVRDELRQPSLPPGKPARAAPAHAEPVA